MAVTIAPVAEVHVESLWRALDAVAREGRWLALLQAPPLEASRAFVANNLAKGYPHFVALDGATVVGWCDIVGNERAIKAHCGTLGMGLLPAWREQGIGRRLIEAAIAAAWARGLRRIELNVNAGNERALRLYRSVGFVAEGLFRRGARLGEVYVDVIPMALLAPAMLGE